MGRREVELEQGSLEDWLQRDQMEKKVGGPLLKLLSFGKPPQQRVRHKVWRQQLVDNTRQLELGADRARQENDMEVLDGTEMVKVVETTGAGAEIEAAGKGFS